MGAAYHNYVILQDVTPFAPGVYVNSFQTGETRISILLSVERGASLAQSEMS